MAKLPPAPAPGLLERLNANRNLLGLLFMVPAATILLVFLTYPLGLGVWIGLTDVKVGQPGAFVGLDNYRWLMRDQVFWLSVFNTFIDGATRLQILMKIVLPLSVPGLISAGIFAFTLSWNEYIYALTFIASAENKTVPVGVLTELVEADVYNWGGLMAGAMLGSLPVAILYSFFVEHYVASMTGAVKE